ncbi:hypothetical protein KAU55_04580 [Candidatus Bathyarchaeota archaeon]|nr:hypothetical protein [Candidatus Bathyarchaeota archaeon]
MEKIGEPLHPDFQKILRQFQKRYGDKQGLSHFWGWVNNLGLNSDKRYGGASLLKAQWMKKLDIVQQAGLASPT